MKVLLVNGSPHEKGCTYTALSEVARSLEANGVETEIFWLGRNVQGSCLACGYCRTHGKCVMDDAVNEFAEKAACADGFVFGSPVHYAAPSGNIMSFMGRLFFSSGRLFRDKPAASVVSCRRGGSTAALDTLNKFYPIAGMPMVPSQYWNMVHGSVPSDVMKDAEGLQVMRRLGLNMSWMLKSIAAGKAAGIVAPELDEPRQTTNFIR